MFISDNSNTKEKQVVVGKKNGGNAVVNPAIEK